MLKNKKLTSALMLLILLGSCGSKNTLSESGYVGGYEIEIGSYGDYCVTQSTVIECKNSESLQRSVDRDIAKTPVYIYFDPEERMGEIIKLFGFEGEEYSPFMETERYYQSEGKSLRVDAYGCFTFDLDKKSNRLEMPYTPQECLTIAKNYLREKSLLPENVASEWSVDEISGTVNNVNTVYEYGVNIYKGKISGRNVTGNSRITVFVNGDGNVRQITYNWREYRSKERAELISVAEALEKVYNREARFEVNNPSAKLSIKKVEVYYYEQARSQENLAIQPIYVFSGISTTTQGEKEDFAVIVQANRVTG